MKRRGFLAAIVGTWLARRGLKVAPTPQPEVQMLVLPGLHDLKAMRYELDRRNRRDVVWRLPKAEP